MQRTILTFPLLALVGLASTASVKADEVAGNALQFDGNDSVMVLHSTAFDGHNTVTVEMWILPDSDLVGGRLFDQWGTSADRKWYVGLRSIDEYTFVEFLYRRGVCIQRLNSAVVPPLLDGQWHHIAVAKNERWVYFYVDGQLGTIGQLSGTGNLRPNVPIALGSRGNFEAYFEGMMDEVRFWNYARSPAEIAAHYNRVIDPDTPGLIGYWDFNEELDDQNVFDASPNAHDGTLGGSSAVEDDDPLRILSSAPIIAAAEPSAPSLDVKPGSCPNPFNRASQGYLTVAVVGTEDFGVAAIDVSSVRLSRADGVGGEVAPNDGPPGPPSTMGDVATPFEGEPCDCHELQGDGTDDLRMHFISQELVAVLQLAGLDPRASVELIVTGQLTDGTGFTTSGDCIWVLSPPTHARDQGHPNESVGRPRSRM